MRLAGGSSRYEGRVEINYENQWGTVCDDSWDSNDTAVVCRQLGYSSGESRSRAYFGRGSGPIWMDNVECGGSESSLDQCRFNGWGNHNCHHSEDAGVVCQLLTPTPPPCSSWSRVRKDFMSMSSVEKRRYINAVVLASTNSRYKREYDNLLGIHHDNFDTMIHRRDEFLPWHRWFLLQYENLLRRIDSRITLPFWDWRGDRPLSTSSSSMWHHNYFGGNGQPCVTNGPFQGSQWSLPDRSYLERNFDHEAIFPDYVAVARLLNENNLTEFESILRVQMHNNVHCHVGGTMCSLSAAYAPEFFLHHAFIDKLWEDWQNKRGSCRTTYFGNIDSAMTAASGATPRQFLDNCRLPGGVSVKYAVTPSVSDIERTLSRQSTSMLSRLPQRRVSDLNQTAIRLFGASETDRSASRRFVNTIRQHADARFDYGGNLRTLLMSRLGLLPGRPEPTEFPWPSEPTEFPWPPEPTWPRLRPPYVPWQLQPPEPPSWPFD